MFLQASLSGINSMAHVTLERHLFLMHVCVHFAWNFRCINFIIRLRPCQIRSTSKPRALQSAHRPRCFFRYPYVTQTCHIHHPIHRARVALFSVGNSIRRFRPRLGQSWRHSLLIGPTPRKSEAVHHVAAHHIHIVMLYSGRCGKALRSYCQ